MDRTIAQFADAPIGAVAFACTGASYLRGVERERATVEAIEAARNIAGRNINVVTAGRAVAEALQRLGATKIGLVSPYSPGLTEASIAYWRAHGFDVRTVARVTGPDDSFHPVYDLSAARVAQALAALDLRDVDAVVMLGTGMPTLASMLRHAAALPVPVLSCLSALAWRALAVFDRGFNEADAMRRFFAGAGWRQRFDSFTA
jgi:maleate isomerase